MIFPAEITQNRRFCHKLPIRRNPQKSAIVFFVLKFLVANLWQILWRVFLLSNRAKQLDHLRDRFFDRLFVVIRHVSSGTEFYHFDRGAITKR